MVTKLVTLLTVILGAGVFGTGQASAKDDGGFGSARFTAQVPAALSDMPVAGGSNVMATTTLEVTPADIEPASGEEDIRPDVEQLDGTVMMKSEHPDDTIIIQKDMTIR